MPEPSEPKPNIYGTLAGPDAPQKSPESEKLGSDLAGLQQHADAPKLDGYLMLRSIGNGAYAQVWEAIQLRTRRLVAVKVFHKKGILQWNLLQREADRMIRLDKHPHIVSLLDADLRGSTPYYVMDLAEAGSLENVIQNKKNMGRSPKDVYQAATWMQEIAEALSYVHAREIVHCDLKPANVLLDQEGHVRVADFGHSLVLTDSGGALGSLFYMAPEQTEASEHGQIIRPDVRWDIYALGCTVYHLLSGQPPHEEIEIEIEMTPVLATRLKIYRKAVETQPVPDLHALTQGRVDKDLSAIVAKCMKVNPDERYSDVSDVLKDIKRRWQGKPVSPLAHDKVYTLLKYATRYKVALIISSAALAISLASAFIAVEHQKSQAQDLALNDILRGKECLDNGDNASATAYFAEANRINPSLLARGNAFLSMPPMPNALLNYDKPIQTIAFNRNGSNLLLTGASSAVLWNPKNDSHHALKLWGKNTAAAFSADGRRVATGDAQGEIKVFEVSKQKLISIGKEPNGQINCLVFSPDGLKLATGTKDGTLRFWNPDTGEGSQHPIDVGAGVVSVEFSRDGKYLLTAAKDGSAHVWDTENSSSQSNPIRLMTQGAPDWYHPDVFFLNDNKIAAAGWDGYLRFYNRDGGRAGNPLQLDGLGAKAFLSASGHQLVTAVLRDKISGLLRIYGVKSRRPSPIKFKTIGRVTAFALSADGGRLMAGTVNHSAQVWQTDSGKPLSLAFWQGDAVTSAAFSPSGKILATADQDGVARLWNFAARADDLTELDWKKSGRKNSEKSQTRQLFTRDGKHLLTYSAQNAYWWNAATGKAEGSLMTGHIKTALFSPNDQSLLLLGPGGAKLWFPNAKKSAALPTQGTLVDADFSESGKKLVLAAKNKTLFFFDPNTGAQLGSPVSLDTKITQVKLSPDGSQVAVVTDKGSLGLYSAKGGPALVKLNKWIKATAFTADSQKLLAAEGATGMIFDTSSGKHLKSFQQPGLKNLFATPDSKTIISFSADGTIRLWDAQTAEPLGSPMKHPGEISQMILSPQGNALLVVYQDKTREIWDTHSGETIGGEMPNGAAVKALAFDQDSRGYKMVEDKGKIVHVNTDWVDTGLDPGQLVKTSEVAGLCKVSGGFAQPISTDRWISLWKELKKSLVP